MNVNTEHRMEISEEMERMRRTNGRDNNYNDDNSDRDEKMIE